MLKDNVKPYLIQKGEVRNPKGKPKGTLSTKTKGWDLLKETITTGLTDKFMQEMEGLEGTQYINAYLNVLEFFRPRLSRAETINQNENIETITVTLSQSMVQFPDNVDETEVVEISSVHTVGEPDRTLD